ncbi:thermonuclease family protein [Rhizobium ruizarguesonis]|nr:thermonuclease family protein [Rhizobium ruizarguesonis]TBD17982.1 thermonuclease family protein [Rhizobium ruizarguesonis]TBE99225.1 thermonuclease family protein [Rhizobium ruizarguesonis]
MEAKSKKVGYLHAKTVYSRNMFKRIGIVFLQFFLIAAVAPTGSAEADTLVGRASVIDGDTVEIIGKRIRLSGIDAPESWQVCRDEGGRRYRCGKDAAFALDEFLSRSRPTTCRTRGKDRYRRFVADCTRADGENVNAWLVRQGFAVDWWRYSKGMFKDEQGLAKASRIGIWRGSFDLPCEARAMRSKRPPAC